MGAQVSVTLINTGKSMRFWLVKKILARPFIKITSLNEEQQKGKLEEETASHKQDTVIARVLQRTDF